MTEQKNVPPVRNPSVDLGDELRYLIGEMGTLMDNMGGYRIKIYHTRAFPWDDVFKTLLYRGFKVYVTNHKADLFIEAQP
jgi:hypothetical protein